MNILGPVRRKLKKQPVTIAFGILGKKSIVMAADTQTTRDKTPDTQKISVLRLKDSNALLAQAGNATNSRRAIEIMTDLAKDAPIVDYRTVADIARRAMIKLGQELREQRGPCSAREFDEFFWENEQQAFLMISHFFNERPHIFVSNLFFANADLVADREHSQFAAMGTGAQTAEYILGRINIPSMDSTDHATKIMVTAMYVIEEMKRVDTYCGGSMTLGFIHSPDNETAIVPPNAQFDRIARIIKDFEKDFSAEWAKKMEDMIWKISGTEKLSLPPSRKDFF